MGLTHILFNRLFQGVTVTRTTRSFFDRFNIGHLRFHVGLLPGDQRKVLFVNVASSFTGRVFGHTLQHTRFIGFESFGLLRRGVLLSSLGMEQRFCSTIHVISIEVHRSRFFH